MNQEELLKQCLTRIEAKTGWGPAAAWTNQDFTTLSEKIAAATDVHLSATTLKRVWGRVAYASKPSPTTLNTLAVYLGFADWRSFRQSVHPPGPNGPRTNHRPPQAGTSAGAPPTKVAAGKQRHAGTAAETMRWPPQHQGTPPGDHALKVHPDQAGKNHGQQRVTEQNAPPHRQARNPLRLYLYYLAPLVGLAVAIALLFPTSPAPAPAPAETTPLLNPADFSFNFRPVTSGVPNSVVFTYDATAAPADDSVFLQQNWDSSRRFRIPREANVYTSIYYLPGFFKAKLVVGEQVVKTREVYIRSEGWVTAADRQPVPVYLPMAEVHKEGRLTVTPEVLQRLEVPLQPDPPKVIFTHVGALDGLFSDDFSFSTRLRHDYRAGTSACQRIRILLLLKDGAIIIPLSQPGCTADLRLYAGGRAVDGRTNDLSAFGVVSEDQWLQLAGTGNGDLLTFSLNGQVVLTLESQEAPKEFVGIRYEFMGPGSVDEVTFSNSSGLVWREEF